MGLEFFLMCVVFPVSVLLLYICIKMDGQAHKEEYMEEVRRKIKEQEEKYNVRLDK